MSRKFFAVVFVLIMSVALVLSGCSSKKEPKEALQNAAANTFKLDSYVLNNQIKIKDLSINFPNADDPSVNAMATMLKNAEINVSQVYQKDPMQTEATMEIKLQGDVATTITIPFVMTKDKWFVKIPQVPFLPLPDTVVGKFLVIDLKEMAKQGGEDFNPDMLNPEKSQKLAAEITNAVFAEYDGKTYFKDIDPKDAALPEGTKAKQVVQFNVTNDNVKDAVTIFVKQALPKILDILNKDEYRQMLQIKPEDLADAKKELAAGDDTEFNKALADMQKYLSINTFTINTAIDKNDYPVYQKLDASLDFNDPDTKENVKVAFEVSSAFSKINEKPEFKIGIPTNTITMDQFEQEVGALGY
ncbi:DUF6612 family protein [Paenibacillus caui]|uniref:DUF6612 family protein n=1 Tax=Paenibacillus caui TaxID=2873927 RepID=UPI001CA949BC|nr:DUF6612 family protein [Paenibacillus caui]